MAPDEHLQPSDGGIRASFVAGLGFEPDRFQLRSFDAVDRGHSIVVAAPTGSGKTVVAEYAVAMALAQGGKAFYTTPLKALSNQKYGDLVRRHGVYPRPRGPRPRPPWGFRRSSMASASGLGRPSIKVGSNSRRSDWRSPTR